MSSLFIPVLISILYSSLFLHVAQLQLISMIPYVSKKALMKGRNRNGPMNNILLSLWYFFLLH